MTVASSAAPAEPIRSIAFTGTWREYLPIAVTNALLTIATLGIYRFWATARQRRYLWAHTHVIDDSLEWSGTGKEMFVGFVIVVAILLPFFLFFQFLLPAMVARGQNLFAGLALLVFYIALIFLGGFARFRALRYRLSRTWWHGIRGGSDNPGWAYGREYLGRTFISIITFFIMVPWSMTRLWNSRWNEMSFGPLQFHANLDTQGLKRRWALLYIAPVGALLIGMLAAISAAGLMGNRSSISPGIGGFFILIFFFFYLAIPLATLHFFAKFYRNAAASTTLGEIEFEFDASTWDWLKLFLGNFGLAIVTLGFGLTFWGYRNWSFMVRHMHLYGAIDVAGLTQSTVHSPGEAEGFADMFDVGAI